MTDRKLYVTYGNDAKGMTLDLLEAARIADEIPAGASIALKPNLVVATTPDTGATTHTGILEGAIEYLQAHGHRDISIIEGSWVGDSTARAFSVCGYHDISKRYNVPLYDLKKDATRTVKTPIGDMRVCARALDTDYVISLPVLKGHCQTRMTCALKNSKGCLPDSEKRRFHTLGLDRPIGALAAAFKPSLFIVDSICGDLNFEEGGTPVPTNRMFLGHDPVMIDTYGCRLMGIDPREVDYIGYAEQWGAGSGKIDPDDIVMLNDPSQAPAFPRPSGLVSRLTKNVTQDSACSACYGNLVHALYRLRDFDPGFDRKIYIGQGFRGKNPDGIGVGNCCRGASCPIPGCPPDAEKILQALLEQQ